MSTKRVGGLVMLVLAVFGIFYAVTTYSDDTSSLFGYTYEPPLTEHETTVIAIGVGSALGVIIGLFLLFSQDDTDSAIIQKFWVCESCNTANNQDFAHCTHCGAARKSVHATPVTQSDFYCKKCGTKNAAGAHYCVACGSEVDTCKFLLTAGNVPAAV